MCSAAAAILHADLDAFTPRSSNATVRSFGANRSPSAGGVVLAASYEARASGVRGAMNIREATKLCPTLIVVSPRMDAYTKASRDVFSVFDNTTPLVEPVSIDEAFLDVSGLGRLVGPPAVVADRLRAQVRAEVGLAISVGIARTKFLAKVASGVAKPDGLLVVDPEHELDFLHPLPVGRLWGVGPKTEAKLSRKGITTVGQVAELGEESLVAMLGTGSGRHLHALDHNRDPRRVVTGKRRSSIGSQRALGQRHRSFADLEAVLLELVDRVSGRLRAGGRVGRTVMVRFRFGDFTSDTRSHSLSEATASTPTLLDTARGLLVERREEIQRRGLTLLGFTIANLSPADTVQQSLPFNGRSQVELDVTVDAVRDRYGSGSIGRATLLGRSSGLQVPLLPDPGGAEPTRQHRR